MVDLEILRDMGCSEEALRKVFEMESSGSYALAKTDSKRAEKVDRLRTLIRSRINEGRDNNVANYRVYSALDKAWDSPLNQITPTMVQSLIDSKMDVDKLTDSLKTWGVNLSEVLTEYPDPKNPNNTIKQVNVPAFYRIFVPLLRSYVTIRRAKAMNDRKLVPFMKYEPAISNEMTRMRSEVITSTVENIATTYGYWEVEDQAFWRTLHYGTCFRFLVEEWHREEQLVEFDSPYESESQEPILGPEIPETPNENPAAAAPPQPQGVPDQVQPPVEAGAEQPTTPNPAPPADYSDLSAEGGFAASVSGEATPEVLTGDDEYGEGEDVVEGPNRRAYKKVCIREGLRYHMPHPTRTFYDIAWPATTFNNNTGASYAGYWRVMRYGEIANKKKFFNLSVIAVGNSSAWLTSNKAFFDAVHPCTLRFPGNETAGTGAGANDTENKIESAIYTTADEDKGVILTELFMKIVPSEYGIGDYDFPVWFRFVVANTDTVVYACPLPYSSPVIFDGYDYVSGRAMNPSMSLEILPFQDHFGNLMSQYLLSIKQNLTNMVLVDTDAVEEKDINWLRTATQKLWQAINFVGFSRRKFMKGQQEPNVTFPQRFPQVDTASIAIGMKTTLEILERVLVMSSQELGQAASHEQTREEVRNIQSNTSTRAEFTVSTLDRSKQAWKRQTYEGLMAYGSEVGFAQVAYDPKITPEMLSKLGFTHDGVDEQSKRLRIKYNKTAIKYETFAANRDGDDRINDRELAAQMGAFMQQLAANPVLLQALGPDQFVQMANWVAKASGFPRDLRLVNRGPDMTPDEQAQQQQQQMQQMLQQVLQQFKGEIDKEIKEVVTMVTEENDKQNEEIAQDNKKQNEAIINLMKAHGMAQEAMMPPGHQDLPDQVPPQQMGMAAPGMQ